MSKPKILAYTITHGDRRFLDELVSTCRGTAGEWFDWMVILSGVDDEQKKTAEGLLEDESGIQFLTGWDENRGQHWGTRLALELARERDYYWILRLDDDVRPKTQRWLRKFLQTANDLRDLSGDKADHIVFGPKILGLRNPLHPKGTMDLGQKTRVEIMDVLGGACRLHPVKLLAEYEPDIYNPIGRGDPQDLREYLKPNSGEERGLLARIPSIKFYHKTDDIEAQDSEKMAYQRIMGHHWPYLGPEC